MSVQVVIMCKAPVVGRVKTRLINATIDAAQACALHQQMAAVVIRRAIHHFPNAVTIATDNPDHPFFQPFNQPIVAQGRGDLGQRMARTADTMIDQHSLLFLGTDSPHMNGSRLTEAVELAQRHDAVAGAVEDGGYDLILLNNRKAMVLLHQIDWGSDQVWQQTCLQATKAGLRLATLPLGFDVDCAEDLKRSQHLGWNIADNTPPKTHD
ncbi:MAG: TIGR04282 family arsenosugar biosynthesis glycosyltransferase [Mariprofundales bacterium]